MRKRIVGATAAVVALGIAGTAVAGGFQFRATATSSEEVPPPGVVIVSSAEAKANVKLDEEAQTASYNLRITEPIENVRQAHLHLGAPGANGPIAVWLYPSAPPQMLIAGTTEGRLNMGEWSPADLCWNPTAPASTAFCTTGTPDWAGFVTALKAGMLYLNVHTTAYPGGEIRGQVHGQHDHG